MRGEAGLSESGGMGGMDPQVRFTATVSQHRRLILSAPS